MHTYELVFIDDRDDAVQKLQFEAADSGKALEIVRDVSGTRPMELWEDGKRLCGLPRKTVGEGEAWVVGRRRQLDRTKPQNKWQPSIQNPAELNIASPGQGMDLEDVSQINVRDGGLPAPGLRPEPKAADEQGSRPFVGGQATQLARSLPNGCRGRRS